MSVLSGIDAYWKLSGECAECGYCTPACQSLSAAGMTLGGIAKRMLLHEREVVAAASEQGLDEAAAKALMARTLAADAPLTQAIRGCLLCTTCQQTCFADNDVSELIYAARKDFQDCRLIPSSAWSSVEVDKEWDIFTAYRAIYGISFWDLTRHLAFEGIEAQTDCQVAFFPGCSLAAYAPELTREVFATVEALGGKTTMIDHCCGSPLKSAGFYERALALCDRIADEIAASGASQVVCVCPGCRNAMEATMERRGLDIPAVTLSHFLLTHGFVPKRDVPDATYVFSKSCHDLDGAYTEETCQLLGLGALPDIIFRGCCGAGGAVSAYSYEQYTAQTRRKLAGVPDGATVVSMCPTCTYTYASYFGREPRDVVNKHYLELLFENQFDWDTAFAQLNGMWSGEYGPWLAQIFA